MICSKCKKAINENDNYCNYCGKKINVEKIKILPEILPIGITLAIEVCILLYVIIGMLITDTSGLDGSVSGLKFLAIPIVIIMGLFLISPVALSLLMSARNKESKEIFYCLVEVLLLSTSAVIIFFMEVLMVFRYVLIAIHIVSIIMIIYNLIKIILVKAKKN